MAEYNTNNPAGNGSDELPITEPVKAAFAEAMDLTRLSALGLRIYNSTTATYYILTLTGTAGNEIINWTPDV